MQAFKALSFGDKWRVSMCLRRGEAPGDPRLAAAAVDLAQGYRRQSRVRAMLAYWYPLLAIVFAGCFSILAAARGDQWAAILYALVVPLSVAGYLFDPGRRPENVARALEASRRILPSDWSHDPAVQSDYEAPAGWYAEPDNYVVERLWDGEEWTSWVRPRAVEAGGIEADPPSWQPHPSRPGKELLWSGNDWTDRERDSLEAR